MSFISWNPIILTTKGENRIYWSSKRISCKLNQREDKLIKIVQSRLFHAILFLNYSRQAGIFRGGPPSFMRLRMIICQEKNWMNPFLLRLQKNLSLLFVNRRGIPRSITMRL